LDLLDIMKSNATTHDVYLVPVDGVTARRATGTVVVRHAPNPSKVLPRVRTDVRFDEMRENMQEWDPVFEALAKK
jgi:hypothetical protein